MEDEDDAEDCANHYRDTSVLFDVTCVSSIVGENGSEMLAAEIGFIMKLVAVIVVVTLLLTSKSYAEVPVLLITFVVAMLLDMGTNFFFGAISFTSNSISTILQLTLAIGYAIILCRRFSEEREHANSQEVCILALSKAIPEISASCLTTLSGLTAMMFMQFRIGFDMGMILMKAILLSIITVFTLMAGLLMLFGKVVDKSGHWRLCSHMKRWKHYPVF